MKASNNSRTSATKFPTRKTTPLSVTTNSIRQPMTNNHDSTNLKKRKGNSDLDDAKRSAPRPRVSATTNTKRPVKDIRSRMSDMEQKREANQAKIGELSKEWQAWEDSVASKETESREVCQRLMELQALKQMAERKHAEEVERLKSLHRMQTYQLQDANTNYKQRVTELQQDIAMFQERTVKAQNQMELDAKENAELRETIAKTSASFTKLEADLWTMRTKVEEADKKLQESQGTIDSLKQQIEECRTRTKEMEASRLHHEKMRRRLHNTIQELKGNIRVFCRVRPALESEKRGANSLARIRYYGEDGEKLELSEEVSSTLGKTTLKTYPFSFDKVFPPSCSQQECFEEISQLVQSALDGYNVCIFAYGQTGSGKTYTMQGSSNPKAESAGMIPRAVQQIYDVTQKLAEQNWTYTMEGQFLEIYNETVHDLLGDTADYGKIKHEIRHEKNGRTTVTDMTTVILDSPAKVTSMLRKASQNRATGATNLNERSSRSHSVFMLRLSGHNSVTKEQCSGVLNLIDLAGSERLALSGSTGERLRETQAINKSLSCLGDVIHALANNKEGGHVPYRNSKLTYLLQNSLGGNSKTLMFVNISPLMEHFGETLCSLRFATKVNSCRIAVPKKMSK